MKNKVWVFGCSFSSGYLDVKREETYGNLLGEEIGYEVINLAQPGNSNDKLLFDLLQNINNIKNGDIIIFQFSSFNRIGFFDHNHNYFSSAGIPELGVDVKKNEPIFNKIPINELNILLDYILKWQHKRFKFDYENINSILKYIHSNSNVEYIKLFLTNEVIHESEKTFLLPISKDKNNISLNSFFIDTKTTLTDEFPDKYKYFDSHPGHDGHKLLKNILYEKIIQLVSKKNK